MGTWRSVLRWLRVVRAVRRRYRRVGTLRSAVRASGGPRRLGRRRAVVSEMRSGLSRPMPDRLRAYTDRVKGLLTAVPDTEERSPHSRSYPKQHVPQPIAIAVRTRPQDSSSTAPSGGGRFRWRRQPIANSQGSRLLVPNYFAGKLAVLNQVGHPRHTQLPETPACCITDGCRVAASPYRCRAWQVKQHADFTGSLKTPGAAVLTTSPPSANSRTISNSPSTPQIRSPIVDCSQIPRRLSRTVSGDSATPAPASARGRDRPAAASGRSGRDHHHTVALR